MHPSELKPIDLRGDWTDGCALDLYTLRSRPLGPGPAGHMTFDHDYTRLGSALYRLKYRGIVGLAAPLGQIVADFAVLRWPGLLDAVVSVPPSAVRPVQPLALIAQAVAEHLKLPNLSEAIASTGEGGPVKDVSDAAQREAMLANRFSVRAEQIPNRRLLLVDDLYRSGATARAVSRGLLAAGAAAVYFVAITKTRSNA